VGEGRKGNDSGTRRDRAPEGKNVRTVLKKRPDANGALEGQILTKALEGKTNIFFLGYQERPITPKEEKKAFVNQKGKMRPARRGGAGI